ncbi:ubiquitin-conjugating enzyme/RWD-like protein [Penicillium manginii]|uniref:ubiquitin-conjugating enzyme/RWD-like protein n=1 Tax=Penicillium manginii TaxID=203109 RepID=UPI00254746F7|nr:ubiquitin-conjugating enzyme/RWD-like protein [Penicillium manginii]KAJ5742926.1 ubiquitin-conjugating enzyme/RWD-like protein [Penicillium manginii]
MAERILMNEFRTLSKEKWVNIELHHENIFKWDVALIVLNQDSLYHGGYLKASMTFPQNYPYSPPVPLYHPNIYADGRLCISILHPPGEDEMSGELAAERCLLPANVDAAVMLRKNPTKYHATVKANVDGSRKLAPPGFTMPVEEAPSRDVEKDDDDFWMDSDVDSDPFGGSDSDEDMDQISASEDDDDDDDDDSEDAAESHQR